MTPQRWNMAIWLAFLVVILACYGEMVNGQDSLVAESGASTATTTETAGSSAVAEPASPSETTAAKGEKEEPVQSGPLIDLLGTKLYKLKMLDEESARIEESFTNEALAEKKVIGLYFSADWCGPCRQFTPELVTFYEKMNKKRKNSFEIVWVSRCRDVESYANYFAHMPWLALPPEEASGERGEFLGRKYGVQGIPSLVLLDDLGQTIVKDARNKVPQDRNGIGFPWRDPISQLYTTLVPRSLRLLVKLQIDSVRHRMVQKVKSLFGFGRRASAKST